MHKCTSYGQDRLNLWPFYPLTFNLWPFKCDLDLQHIWKNVSNGTSTPQGEQLCKNILKPMRECTSYGPDKSAWMHAHTTHAHTPNWSCNNYVPLTTSGLHKNHHKWAWQKSKWLHVRIILIQIGMFFASHFAILVSHLDWSIFIWFRNNSMKDSFWHTFGQNPFSGYWECVIFMQTCDSTAGSKKIPFIKPVCRSTVPVDQTTLFENFRKYFENPNKKSPHITFLACTSLTDANQFINQQRTRVR